MSRSNVSALSSADIQHPFFLILNFFLLAPLSLCCPSRYLLHDSLARCFDDPLYALTPMLAKNLLCLSLNRLPQSLTILITRSSGE